MADNRDIATGMRASPNKTIDDTGRDTTTDPTTTPTAAADKSASNTIPGEDMYSSHAAPLATSTPAADTALMPPPPLPQDAAKATRQERDIIHLYHVAMLVLAQRPEKPVIHLDNPHAIRLLDAALGGQISEAGELLSLPRLRSGQTIKDYVSKCEEYVPQLRARIHAQNAINVQEPANQGDERHEQLSKLVITPEMLSVFKTFIRKENIRGEVLEPEKEFKVFLEGIVDDQYDLDAWVHIENKLEANMKPLLHSNGAIETFAPSMEYPGYIEAVMKVKIPGTEEWVSQIDLIKDLSAPISKQDKKTKKKRAIFFDPYPKNIVIPKKKQISPWHTEDAKKMLWTRSGGKVFALHFFVRKFDAHTGEYIKARFIDLNLLRNIDPNDEVWRQKYNDHFRMMGPSKKSSTIESETVRKRKRGARDAQNDVEGEEESLADVFGGSDGGGDASPRKKAKLGFKEESVDLQAGDDTLGQLATEGLFAEDFGEEVVVDWQEDEVEEAEE